MNKSTLVCLCACAMTVTAHADVWKWVDARGNTHFVDTMKPIYTWVDEFDKVHYSDTPDHEDAVSVELVWVSSRTLKETQSDHVEETEEQRAVREAEVAYHCEKATQVFEAVLNAPQLYRINEAGEREILSEKETAATIADTRKKKEEYCR